MKSETVILLTIVAALAGAFVMDTLYGQSISAPVMVYKDSAIRWFDTELVMTTRIPVEHTETTKMGGVTVTNGVRFTTNETRELFRLGLRPDGVLIGKPVQ